MSLDLLYIKALFQDALVLCYNWLPLRTPSNCACGVKFSVEHALSCSKGGFPSIRRNEIRDLTANLLTEVCSDVCIELDLQLMVRYSLVLLPTPRMVQDLILLPMLSGVVGLSELSLMFGFSTLMPPPTGTRT